MCANKQLVVLIRQLVSCLFVCVWRFVYTVFVEEGQYWAKRTKNLVRLEDVCG
jgi:hypothetical protein